MTTLVSLVTACEIDFVCKMLQRFKRWFAISHATLLNLRTRGQLSLSFMSLLLVHQKSMALSLITGYHVCFSRPCRWSEFTLNRASVIAFGAKVQIPVPRQWGREMSPRPHFLSSAIFTPAKVVKSGSF